MPNLIILLIISNGIAIVAVFLYAREHRQLKKKITENNSLRASEAKGNSIIHRAMNKAREIIGKAELEGVEVVAGSKISVRKFEGKYEEELDKQMQQALTEFNKYLADIRTRTDQIQLLSENYTKERAAEIFEKFEQNLASFLTSTEQKSVAAIELELKAARQLIDTYKAQQLALIDENIISMLEKTLSLVLVKKLSLKDQLDLVYEALEKAKVEKFIA